MKALAHCLPWLCSVVLIVAFGAGCAESTRKGPQAATVPTRDRSDAGEEDAGARPLDDSCPQEVEPEVEPNDRAAQAQRVQPCIVYRVTGEVGGEAADADWFKVRVPPGITSLSVSVEAHSGTGPELWILASENEPVEHRAIGAGEAVRVTTGVEAGEYLIRAHSGATSRYDLTVELGELGYELESTNDQPADAQSIAFDTTYTGQDSALGASEDLDWFKLDVPEGASSIEVEVEDIGAPDPIETEVWLLRAGVPAIEHRAVHGAGKVALIAGVTSGEYFVRVQPGERRSYTLRAALSDEPVELEECNDVAQTAQRVALGTRYEGGDSAETVEQDWDWFQIEVPAGTISLAIQLEDLGEGSGPSTTLTLYRSAMHPIERRTLAAGESLDVQLGVTEGTYFAEVLVGKGRRYALTVAEDDTPFELEESNDAREDAPEIEASVTYGGQGSALATESHDEDWFRIAVPQSAQTVTVTVTDTGRGDEPVTDLTVFDPAGLQIGYLAPEPGDAASAKFRVGEPGEHALVVRAGYRRSYRVEVSFWAIAP